MKETQRPMCYVIPSICYFKIKQNQGTRNKIIGLIVMRKDSSKRAQLCLWLWLENCVLLKNFRILMLKTIAFTVVSVNPVK